MKPARPEVTGRARTDLLGYQIWLDGIVRVAEGARLRGVSVDTLKRSEGRNGRNRLINVGERALGIRRRHALLID